MNQLREMWLKAAEPYHVKDGSGVVKLETIELPGQEPHEEASLEEARMAFEFTAFIVKHELNNCRPITPGNIRYWRKIGRVTHRILRTVQLWVDSRQRTATSAE